MQILLYKLRKEHNMTQADIADILGRSENSYRQKELGHRDFWSSEMFLIADFFNKDIKDIFLDLKATKRVQN
ncbi:helix-turn-helix transcriptional regulator [Streptococcus ictaluri]|uniref:DNA-binding helix-turn-helix protein n=1 Tax=Streptococcus ictaluri 707-05 TaxID=764299 RepID=G5K3S6_9STRE|nr:helix-turn-helix transcriptional regulator [Streptococcus ictaluri]EHI69504.1 DNA-binding helix-turn-helix protein [Streptococcus ictaluri 707-05]QBX25544.1 repressor [Streptococcus phage Javan262]